MRTETARHGNVILALALFSLAANGCATAASGKLADAPIDRQSSEQWGVEPVAIRLSAAGHMLDFRLRVLDAQKAAPLLVRNTDCYVIAEKSGDVLQVARSPKVGALRSTVRAESMVKEDRVYGALFANRGRLVEVGDQVTVVMGEFRAEHLVVE
jgi:hypothetical protein